MGLGGLGLQQPEGKRGLDRTNRHLFMQNVSSSIPKTFIVLRKTFSHLHLNVGLGVTSAGFVARVRVAALAFQAALGGRSDGLS